MKKETEKSGKEKGEAMVFIIESMKMKRCTRIFSIERVGSTIRKTEGKNDVLNVEYSKHLKLNHQEVYG